MTNMLERARDLLRVFHAATLLVLLLALDVAAQLVAWLGGRAGHARELLAPLVAGARLELRPNPADRPAGRSR